jgi:hypothetical protein
MELTSEKNTLREYILANQSEILYNIANKHMWLFRSQFDDLNTTFRISITIMLYKHNDTNKLYMSTLANFNNDKEYEDDNNVIDNANTRLAKISPNCSLVAQFVLPPYWQLKHKEYNNLIDGNFSIIDDDVNQYLAKIASYCSIGNMDDYKSYPQSINPTEFPNINICRRYKVYDTKLIMSSQINTTKVYNILQEKCANIVDKIMKSTTPPRFQIFSLLSYKNDSNHSVTKFQSIILNNTKSHGVYNDKIQLIYDIINLVYQYRRIFYRYEKNEKKSNNNTTMNNTHNVTYNGPITISGNGITLYSANTNYNESTTKYDLDNAVEIAKKLAIVKQALCANHTVRKADVEQLASDMAKNCTVTDKTRNTGSIDDIKKIAIDVSKISADTFNNVSDELISMRNINTELDKSKLVNANEYH